MAISLVRPFPQDYNGASGNPDGVSIAVPENPQGVAHGPSGRFFRFSESQFFPIPRGPGEHERRGQASGRLYGGYTTVVAQEAGVRLAQGIRPIVLITIHGAVNLQRGPDRVDGGGHVKSVLILYQGLIWLDLRTMPRCVTIVFVCNSCHYQSTPALYTTHPSAVQSDSGRRRA